jgi:hypothetical protein
MSRRAVTGSFGFVVALISASATLALALDVTNLRGELFIAGKTVVDPPPTESQNSHAYVTIEGPAALRMYRNMRAKAEDDLCREGNKIKRAGNLACSVGRNGREASCDFALDLVNGTIAPGQPC